MMGMSIEASILYIRSSYKYIRTNILSSAKITYRGFLLLCCRDISLGASKISKKMGSNFLNITVDTAKFLSSRSTLFLNSWGRLAISDHFFILLKNWIKLKRTEMDKLIDKNQNTNQFHVCLSPRCFFHFRVALPADG